MVDKRKYGFRGFMCVMDFCEAVDGHVVHGHQWLSLAGPFPPSPSRACQGLPWRGATLIAQSRAGSPIHGSGIEAAPCFGGATHMRVGAERGRGGRKKWKGARKKDLFLWRTGLHTVGYSALCGSHP